MDIHIDEDVVATLDKYCNPKIRPGILEAIVDRIIHEWALLAYKEWLRRPELIPKLKDIPDHKTTGVTITKKTMQDYLKAIKMIETIHGIKINPVVLTTWLCIIFIKAYGIKKKSEDWKTDFGHNVKI